MHCPYCGKEISENAKVCPYCGRQQHVHTAPAEAPAAAAPKVEPRKKDRAAKKETQAGPPVEATAPIAPTTDGSKRQIPKWIWWAIGIVLAVLLVFIADLPVLLGTDSSPREISGRWSGLIEGADGSWSSQLELTIYSAENSTSENFWGEWDLPEYSCTGDLEFWRRSQDGVYVFREHPNFDSGCTDPGGYQFLQLNSSNTLKFGFSRNSNSYGSYLTIGILTRK